MGWNPLHVPDPVNIFQRTAIDADGRIAALSALTRPGDSVTLRAEAPHTIVTACSMDPRTDQWWPLYAVAARARPSAVIDAFVAGLFVGLFVAVFVGLPQWWWWKPPFSRVCPSLWRVAGDRDGRCPVGGPRSRGRRGDQPTLRALGRCTAVDGRRVLAAILALVLRELFRSGPRRPCRPAGIAAGAYADFLAHTLRHPTTVVFHQPHRRRGSDYGAGEAVAFVVGVFLASLSWQVLLAVAGARRRRAFPVECGAACWRSTVPCWPLHRLHRAGALPILMRRRE